VSHDKQRGSQGVQNYLPGFLPPATGEKKFERLDEKQAQENVELFSRSLLGMR
jgi:hypothetical protein